MVEKLDKHRDGITVSDIVYPVNIRKGIGSPKGDRQSTVCLFCYPNFYFYLHNMAEIFALLLFASFIFLVLGVISPKIPTKVIRKPLTRKGVFWLFGGLTLVSFVGLAFTVPAVEKKPQESISHEVQEAQEQVVAEENTLTSSTTNTQINTSSTEQVINEETPTEGVESQNNETEKQETASVEPLYVVTKVVDGDTFDVSIDGQTKRIRLIGVDTPETVDPRKPVQCFGKEASNKAVELLLNKKVRLEADTTQGETDKYGRLLRYAFREDGLFYNKWIIENGYAHEYTYNTPYKYQVEFKQAETVAREGKKGLWADNACPIESVTPKQTTPSVPVTQAPAEQKSTQSTGSCLIKGNISSDGRKLYHLPSCPSYSKTSIDEGVGEKWFCSEQEAVQAGWTKAGNC